MVQLYSQQEAVESYARSQYAEGEAKGKAEGEAIGEVKGEMNATLENIKNLMQNMKITTEQAMQMLGVQSSKQAVYRSRL